MKFKENVLLKNFTTFKIGGPARYFCIAKNQKDVITAIKKAKELNLPFFILGGGSNLLVSDKGYKGLIIKVQSSKLKVQTSRFAPCNCFAIKQNYNSKLKTIYAEAGVKLNELIKLSVEKSLTGLEWAAGIPGTLGGAIYGNTGWPSNKKNISSVIKNVEVLAISQQPKIKKFNKSDCGFKYRNSIFKHNKNLIILAAFLQLKKGKKIKIKKEIAEIIKKRNNKIPPGFSAGCIFKNPTGFSAGELIDKCGLKGKKRGGAQISEKHANFIVNLGNAKAKDVIRLIKIMKNKVKNKFGIKLEEEIQYLGF